MDLMYVIVQKMMVVIWLSERFKGAKQYRGLVFVITVMVFKLLNAGIMHFLSRKKLLCDNQWLLTIEGQKLCS